ncbi:MAG: ArnT family glycosyltransferase [Fimbriiglobus sp.]
MTNSPRVGAVIQEVPTGPKTGSREDILWLGVLLAISLTIHGWLYTHTTTTARDSIGFAQLALQYESPKEAISQPVCETFLDVVKFGKPPHPPGYPLLVLGMSQITRSILPGELPEVMLRTAQLTSILAALLLIFPCYGIGKTLFNRTAGFAGAVIFQFLPVAARITSDGLTEAWYLLFLACGIRSGLIGLKENSARGFFLAGLFGGLAYLVRPEGMILPLSYAITTVGFWLSQRVDISTTLFRLLLLTVGTGLICLPYMKTINGVTLKTSGQDILRSPVGFHQAAVPVPLFGATYNPEIHGDQWVWALGAIAKESTKTFHYGSLGFAILGIILVLRDLRRSPEAILLVVVMAINSLLLFKLAMREGGYISERHTLPLALVGTILAGHAVFACRELFRPLFGQTLTSVYVSWLWMLAMTGSCIPLTFRPMHENRAGHKIIGEFLKQNATMEDVVIDPYDWAQFYSGRSLRGVPPDPTQPRYRWAVLEAGESEHLTFTRLDVALNVARDTKNKPIVACEWLDPTDPKKQRRIVLYRQDNRFDPPAKIDPK